MIKQGAVLVFLLLFSLISSVGATQYFYDDFETNDLSNWTGSPASSGCTIATQSGTVANGSYALESSTDNNNEYAYAYKTFTGLDTIYVRAWVYPETVTAQFMCFMVRDSGSGHVINLMFTTSNRMYVYNYGASTGYYSASDVWTEDTWQFIELYVYRGNADGDILVKINDETVIERTDIDTDRGNQYTNIRVGNYYEEIGTVYYDNVEVADTEATTDIYITFLTHTPSIGFFLINGTITANATSTQYDNSTVLNLIGAPLNASYVFNNVTWTGGSTLINNYNYTVTGNNTLTCYFSEVADTTYSFLTFAVILGIACLIIIIFYETKK